jgi:hypothetical protein
MRVVIGGFRRSGRAADLRALRHASEVVVEQREHGLVIALELAEAALELLDVVVEFRISGLGESDTSLSDAPSTPT